MDTSTRDHIAELFNGYVSNHPLDKVHGYKPHGLHWGFECVRLVKQHGRTTLNLAITPTTWSLMRRNHDAVEADASLQEAIKEVQRYLKVCNLLYILKQRGE